MTAATSTPPAIYSASYRIPGSKGEEWRHKVEDNRLELVPYQDDYRIIAGM
jgi:hypothetical protein